MSNAPLLALAAMQPLPRPFRNSVARALAGSLILHALLAIALWQLPGTPAAVPVPEQFVPITLRTLPELPEPADPEAEVEPEPPVESEDEPLAEALPEPADPETESEVEPEPDSRTSAEAADEAEPESPELVDPGPLAPESVDLEAARRIAIARIVESLRADSEFHRFSSDVPGAGAGDDEDPDGDGSDLDVFDRAAQLESNGALTPGRARSRLGRAVADFCNQLTGGFSIFGMVDVCGDPVARADLFGHLRPEYMESVPLCTADEDLDLQIEQTGTGAIGTFKCVLVPRTVREEFYRRFDPDLAGWLPAEEDPAEEDD